MDEYQQFHIDFGMVFGNYSGDVSKLESVIRELDPEANITQLAGGTAVYQFGQHTKATGTNGANGGIDSFKAIVVYCEPRRHPTLFNVEISATSYSFVLLQEVIARIVSGAGIEVVDTVPPHLKLKVGNDSALFERTGAHNFPYN